MPLVILGNGFDLASGLPTQYSDYFKYRNDLVLKFTDDIDMLISEPYKSFLCDEFRLAQQDNYSGNFAEEFKKLNRENELSFFNQLIELNSVYLSSKYPGVDFWEVYFLKTRTVNEIEKKLWSDVESDINKFLNEKSSKVGPLGTKWTRYHNDFSLNKDIDSLLEADIKFKGTTRRNGLFNEDNVQYFNEAITFNKKTLFWKYVVIIFLSKDDVLKDLWNQLSKFEDNFSNYIKKVNEEALKTPYKYKYTDNLIKLDPDSFRSFHILTFNYTKITEDYNEATKKYYFKFVTEYGVKNFDAQVNHVHGTFRDKIIFGIDYSQAENIDLFPFSKTYRKMLNSIGKEGLALPKLDSGDSIIFYGHSLSEYDYSYFQSIFDYYDLYSSNIKLVFKFSYYGDLSHFEQDKKKALLVSKLIKDYGSNMKDKVKGSNLLHKLQLENRLNIEVVTLDKLDIPEITMDISENDEV